MATVVVLFQGGVVMELRELFEETARLLGLETGTLDTDVQSVELQLTDLPDITLEKVPDKDLLALTGLLCHYPDRETLATLFEILLNAHAYGQYTNNAFFAANSDLGQIVLHRMLPLAELTPMVLKEEVQGFVHTLKAWVDAYHNGELLSMGGESASLEQGIAAGGLRV